MFGERLGKEVMVFRVSIGSRGIYFVILFYCLLSMVIGLGIRGNFKDIGYLGRRALLVG